MATTAEGATQSPPAPFELGLTTFVELTPDPVSGQTPSPQQRFANLLEEVELGLDVARRPADAVGGPFLFLEQGVEPERVKIAQHSLMMGAAQRVDKALRNGGIEAG